MLPEVQAAAADNSDQQVSDEDAQSYEVTIEQPFYHIYNPAAGEWERIELRSGFSNGPQAMGSTSSTRSTETDPYTTTEAVAGIIDASAPSSFILVSWNVDFMAAYESERLVVILDYIQSKLVDEEPPLLLLQEVSCFCFPTLLEHPLIRALYALSSISSDTWAEPEASYGIVTLVPHHLAKHMSRIFRVPLQSSMAREALFIDLHLCADGVSESRHIRIANTHLESLRGASDVLRPLQLTRIARRLTGVWTEERKDPDADQDSARAENEVASTPQAGLVAGDMNPIGPADTDLPARVGLLDAWEVQAQVFGSNKEEGWDVEDVDERSTLVSAYTSSEGVSQGKSNFILPDPTHGAGYTWGTQPHNCFPMRRMDKILYTGEGVLHVHNVRRIGVGLKVRVRLEFDGFDLGFDGSNSQLEEWEEDDVEEVWATDHFGLLSRVTVRPGNWAVETE